MNKPAFPTPPALRSSAYPSEGLTPIGWMCQVLGITPPNSTGGSRWEALAKRLGCRWSDLMRLEMQAFFQRDDISQLWLQWYHDFSLQEETPIPYKTEPMKSTNALPEMETLF